MGIEKYLKNTPDLIYSDTSMASIDGEDLKLYKLSNAGTDIGLEWCYSTNFNNTNFIENSYIKTGINSVETAKTGIICHNISQIENKYMIDIDDSQPTWDKINGGFAFGVVYNELSYGFDFNHIYICSNLDYSRLVLSTTAFDSTISNGEQRYLTDSMDKLVTNGYTIKLQSLTSSNILKVLDNLHVVIATIGNDGLPVIKLYGKAGNYNQMETQINARGQRESITSVYMNVVHQLPYYSNNSNRVNGIVVQKHNNEHRGIFTIPHTKQALLIDQHIRDSVSTSIYGGSYYSSVDVQSWTRFMNSTGLRYYDGGAFTNINDIKSNMYMGIMDENGITDCDNRIMGWNEIESSNLPNKNRNGYNWDVYDPIKQPPATDDIETVGYGYFSNTVMGTLYALHNKLDLEKISNWFFTQTEKIDIANNVISLKEIPFSLSTLNIIPIATDLKIGGVNVTYNNENVSVGKIVGPELLTASALFGEFNIPRLSNTFLDYSPYTKYELLLPFAPSPVSLPDWCIDKTVKAIFLYDIYTTSCQYIIECNNERICSVSGTFGVDRPVSAQNVALKEASRISSQVATASSVLGGVMSASVGNIGGIMSGAIGGVSALSQMLLSQKQNYMYTIGANGDTSSIGLCHAVHLKITRTLSAEEDGFLHTYGKPLCKMKKLSEMSGFTKCDNVNTDGLTCSESEKQMIKQLLENGIYI